MPKRYVRGDRAFGRLVKQLPESVTTEIREELNETGRMLLARAQGRAPVYSGKRRGTVPGALRSALSMQVTPVRLSLKVGLVGKATNRKLFYGRLVEFGHRIGHRGTGVLTRLEPITVRGVMGRLLRARRRSAVRRTGVPPHPFLYTVSRAEIYRPFQKMWGRALRAASGTSSDD